MSIFTFTIIITILYLANSGAALICVTIFLILIIYAIEFLLLNNFYAKVIQCEKALIEFHDYLINYRQTPRSKILRKHLPDLTTVVEEESYCERSENMMSRE